MKFGRSPTLEFVDSINQAKRRGHVAWSLSTPSFPPASDLPQTSQDWTKLTPAKGLPMLREKAAEAFFGNWSLPDHECIISAGAKAALFAVLRGALDPGSFVLIPTPAWPSYFDLCAAAGLNASPIQTHLSDGFRIDLAELDRMVTACNAKAIMLSNPCNPTGRILDSAELDGLIEISERFGLVLIIDQSFSQIVFDEERWAESKGRAYDRIVLVDSFSKNFVLQGARVAAAFLPRWLVEPFVIVHQTIMSAAPTPAQMMALHALRSGARMPSLHRQRAVAAGLIEKMRWRAHDQAGTFYFFPWVEDIDAFRRYARERNVYILTGEAFGSAYGRHFRLCFAKPEEELDLIVALLTETGLVD